MPANVMCPNPDCGKSYQVSADYLGRRGRCKACGTEFVFAEIDTNAGQSGQSGISSAGVGNTAQNNTAQNSGTTRVGRTTAPARLGRFQILERVGMGGFGAVYRAQDPQLQRTVALKLLQSTGDKHRDKNRIDRFLVEGRAGARLQHPHIVPVFDAGKDEETGEYYMAAAFIAGAPLSTAVDGKPLELRRAATIVAKLSRALEYAHGQGILHRDVKPDNVMLDQKDNPHLMDFGLARMDESESHLTRDGAVMGTPSYMSPEQCIGKQDALGPAADQYSLGCLFYELLTGEKLFDGPVTVQIHHQINTEAPSPSKKNAAIPRDLDTICLKTLAKDPANRYASCAAFAADLEHWLADEPIQARQLTSWERWQRWRKKNPAIAGLSMGLAAALLIGLVGITTQWVRAEGNARIARKAADDQRKATEVAVAAEKAAVASEKVAVAAEKAATAERHTTQMLLVESYVQRGRFLCLQDQVAHGLLWMARGLRSVPAGEAEAEKLIARRIGAWEPLIPKRQLMVHHTKPVWSVRFEPQGKWFVTTSRDHTARIWDTTTGQPLSPPLQHDKEAIAVDISDDGRRVLTACYDGKVRQWQAPDGTPIGQPINCNALLYGAAYADGGLIVARSIDKLMHFRDMDTGQPRREPIVLKSSGRVAVTRDRRTIVVIDDREVATFDTNGKEFGTRMSVAAIRDPRALTTSPDGKTILAGGMADTSSKGVLLSWESTGERKPLKSVVEGPGTGITDAAYSPDGKWLLTGTLHRSAERRSSQDFQRAGYPWSSVSSIRSVAWHPEGKLVLTGGDDGTATMWSLPKPERERLVIRSPAGVYSATYSPDEKTILSSGTDGAVRLWNAETGAAVGQPVQHQGPVLYATFSPEGQLGASSGGTTVLIWSARDGKVVGPPLQHPKETRGVHFNNDGRTLATGCVDGIVRLWDVATGKLISETEKHPAKVWPVAYSRDGKLFAAGIGLDSGQTFGDLRIWDATSRKLIAGPMSHPGMIWNFCFGHHDGWVATSADLAARVWDINTSQVVRGPFWHPATVNGAIFDPSETMLVTSCGDGRVRFWDLESQLQFGPDLVHGDMAVGLSFSSDGRRLVTGSMDGTVRVWDVPQPATGTPEEIEGRIQRAIGQRLTKRGDLENMGANTW